LAWLDGVFLRGAALKSRLTLCYRANLPRSGGSISRSDPGKCGSGRQTLKYFPESGVEPAAAAHQPEASKSREGPSSVKRYCRAMSTSSEQLLVPGFDNARRPWLCLGVQIWL